MKTKYLSKLTALATITTLTLAGAALCAEKLITQGVARVAQGRSVPYDADGFLARYYEKGASAGSTWESLVDNRN